MNEQRVAVVIVNHNGAGVLDRALACIDRQTRPFDRVIVVDNASSDGSATGLASSVEVVALDDNVGFAAGNNRGIERAADCAWIALVNPDAYLAEDWLERMLEAALSTGAGSVGCVLVDEGDRSRLDGVADVYHLSGLAWRRMHGAPRSLAPTERAEIFGPCAAAALYDRAALLEVGAFEERFFCYLEDVDLAFRLRLRGYSSVYEPSAVAYHVGSALTGSDSAFTIYHVSRNLVWTFLRDVPSPLVRYLPQHLLVNVSTMISLARAGHGRTVLRAKRDAVRGIPWALRTRREIQGSRRVEAAQIRRHVLSGARGYLAAQREVRGWR